MKGEIMKPVFEVHYSDEFVEWLSLQNVDNVTYIMTRMQRIAVEGHFGYINYFDNIIELKWRSGLRVYCSRLDRVSILILLGGNKNGQSKDIDKAKKILWRFKNEK